jgi:Uma2 family endonuclease
VRVGHGVIVRQDYTIATLADVQPDVDMNGWFLCFWTYWQPDPAAPDPEMPGLKQEMVTYLPVAPAADCLCGSGKSYAGCCQTQTEATGTASKADMIAYRSLRAVQWPATSIGKHAVCGTRITVHDILEDLTSGKSPQVACPAFSHQSTISSRTTCKNGARVVSSDPKTLLTEEEYLAIERRAESRSEFHGGEMFAMAGASRPHNRVVTNLVIVLGTQLRDSPCSVYSNDMRVRVTNTGLFPYPDVVVTCGEEEFADDEQDTLLNPLVIFEVLSDSTEAYDRGKMFEHYQNIGSLSTYVLVTQDAPRIEQYVRQEDGSVWIYTEAHGADAGVGIEVIACNLKLDDVYAKV